MPYIGDLISWRLAAGRSLRIGAIGKGSASAMVFAEFQEGGSM
jgi:hypothetical protein